MKKTPKSKEAAKTRPASAPETARPFRKRSPAGPRWAACGLGFTVFFFLLLQPFFSGDLEPRWDARDEFYPSFTYFADSIREGRFPLWDPYTSCGYPFHAEPHQPTLNPAAILIALTVSDTSLGFLLYWTIHWWWGGVGMMWLTGRNGAAPSAGLLAALAYAFSGFFIGNAEHTPFIPVAGWLPWIIGLADFAVRRSSCAHALLAGGVLGWSALGGYPTLLSFTGLAVALWLGLRYLPGKGADPDDPRDLGGRARWVGGTLLAMAILSLAIWSPVLAAFFREGSGFTDRISALSPAVANFADVFSFPAMFSLLHPRMTIVAAGPWMQADISMTNAYMGILTIPLAAFWFFRKEEGATRPWWLVGFFLFMFLLSLGGKAGLRTALYYLYPPLKYGRYSAIFRLYWIFALCFAAALGFTRLLARPGDRRDALLLLLAWTGLAVAASIGLFFFLGSRGIAAAEHVPRLFLPGALVLPFGVLALGLWGRGKGGALSRLAPALLVLAYHADMGGHLVNNMDTVGVPRDSIRQVERFHRRETRIVGEPGPRHPPRPWNYFNAQQVIKEPVVQGYIAMQSRGFDEILSRSRFVEVMQSPVRFWVSPGAERAPSEETALSILSGTGAGSPVPVFTEDIPAGLPPARVVPGTYGEASIRFYAPERIEMEAEVPGHAGAFLASTERFAPGWNAWVDGVPQRVSMVNLYFRGIPLPAGRHTILWAYEPGLWRPLVAVSFLTLALSLGTGAVLLFSHRRKETPGMSLPGHPPTRLAGR